MREKQVYRLNEFLDSYGIGRTMAYSEIAKGRLRVFKIGRLTMITREAAQEWVSLHEQEFAGLLPAPKARSN